MRHRNLIYFGLAALFVYWLVSPGVFAAPSFVNTTNRPTLYSRGILLGEKEALVSDSTDGRMRLLFTTNMYAWRQLCLSNSIDGEQDLALTLINENTWLARFGGSAWLSHNLGTTWQNVKSASNIILESDPSALAQLGWLGALKYDEHSGVLSLRSTNAFELFDSVTVISPTRAVASVQFFGKYGASTFALVKTDDSGLNWRWLVKEGGFTFDKSGNYLAHHIFFATENIGWVSSDYLDDIFHTTDGGKTWLQIKTPDRVTSSIFFRNEIEGRIIGGSTGRIYETKDGGRSWRTLANSEVLGASFLKYFEGFPRSRWNDFGIYYILLHSQNYSLHDS